MRLLLSIFIFAITSTTFADNPQIRICRITEGNFWALNITNDQIGFCNYSGALLDSVSIMGKVHYGETSKAVQALLNPLPLSSCGAADAIEVRATDSNTNVFSICEFTDNSYLLKRSLVEGPHTRFNKQLIDALSFK